MKNKAFHFRLRKLRIATPTGPARLTVERIAEAIMVNRQHLTDVINNKPGCGGNTRWKVIKFLKANHPDEIEKLLAALGWNEAGELVKPEVGNPTNGSM